MRIWDLSPDLLCRAHLLGEHNELHCIWNTITQNRKAWSNHPETNRWRGKLKALYNRHTILADEMIRRGYNHQSPLDVSLAIGPGVQDVMIDTIDEQKAILTEKSKTIKGCTCNFKDKM